MDASGPLRNAIQNATRFTREIDNPQLLVGTSQQLGSIAELKEIVKGSGSHAGTLAGELLVHHLAAKDSRQRVLALEACNELFLRSKAFRAQIVDEFNSVVKNTIDPQGNSIPGPAWAARELRLKALEYLEAWTEKYGNRYKQLSLAHRYLKQKINLKFPHLRSRAQRRAEQVEKRQERTQSILRVQFAKIRCEMRQSTDGTETLCHCHNVASQVSNLIHELNRFDSVMELIVPSVANLFDQYGKPAMRSEISSMKTNSKISGIKRNSSDKASTDMDDVIASYPVDHKTSSISAEQTGHTTQHGNTATTSIGDKVEPAISSSNHTDAITATNNDVMQTNATGMMSFNDVMFNEDSEDEYESGLDDDGFDDEIEWDDDDDKKAEESEMLQELDHLPDDYSITIQFGGKSSGDVTLVEKLKPLYESLRDLRNSLNRTHLPQVRHWLQVLGKVEFPPVGEGSSHGESDTQVRHRLMEQATQYQARIRNALQKYDDIVKEYETATGTKLHVRKQDDASLSGSSVVEYADLLEETRHPPKPQAKSSSSLVRTTPGVRKQNRMFLLKRLPVQNKVSLARQIEHLIFLKFGHSIHAYRGRVHAVAALFSRRQDLLPMLEQGKLKINLLVRGKVPPPPPQENTKYLR